MDQSILTALAGVCVAALSIGGAWLTSRATSRSAIKVSEQAVSGQIESAKLQAEENAFNFAKDHYESVIASQKREREEDQAEIHALRLEAQRDREQHAREREEDRQRHAAQIRELQSRVNGAEQELARCHKACKLLARRLGEARLPGDNTPLDYENDY